MGDVERGPWVPEAVKNSFLIPNQRIYNHPSIYSIVGFLEKSMYIKTIPENPMCLYIKLLAFGFKLSRAEFSFTRMSARSWKTGWHLPTRLASLGLTHQSQEHVLFFNLWEQKKAQDTFYFIWEQSSKTTPWGGIVPLRSHKSNFTSLYLKNEVVASPKEYVQKSQTGSTKEKQQGKSWQSQARWAFSMFQALS